MREEKDYGPLIARGLIAVNLFVLGALFGSITYAPEADPGIAGPVGLTAAILSLALTAIYLGAENE